MLVPGEIVVAPGVLCEVEPVSELERELEDDTAGVVEDVGNGTNDIHIGDRVFFLHTGCLATSITIPATSCRRIPSELSFEEAATMPCVFATAIHCLVDIGRLRKGESVLIHSACGGKL